MTFPARIETPIRNHLSGRTYHLIRASELPLNESTLGQIAEVCSEPEIYRWLFQSLFAGQPYDVEKARGWLERSRSGWRDGTHFVFPVVDPAGKVAAACDLKSADPIVEVGYWSSERHRGIMTNTVNALIALARSAGFAGCFARARPGNHRSTAVLARAGFSPRGLQPDGTYRFELPFAKESESAPGRMSRNP